MIPAEELAGLRSTVTETMTETAIIFRVVRQSNDGGGHRETWEPIEVGVLARLDPPTGMIEVEGGALVESKEYRVLFPAETDVRGGDRVQVGDAVLQITGTRSPRTLEIERVATGTVLHGA